MPSKSPPVTITTTTTNIFVNDNEGDDQIVTVKPNATKKNFTLRIL